MCRHPVDGQKLVLNRDLDGIISQQQMRCKHSKEEGGRAAKRAKPTPAASMTVEALKEKLRQRGLPTGGKKAELVARLEEDRGKDAGKACEWEGKVGELGAHLGECQWAPVKCLHTGCTKLPLRRDRLEHGATCEHRKIECEHCGDEVTSRSHAKHEAICPHMLIDCPNESCVELSQRGSMNLHRAECEDEEVTCPCPGCDARLLRKGMDAHVEATHLGSAVKLLQSAWREIDVLEGNDAELKSEKRLAAASKTSRVFNWRAEGWGGGLFKSETHDFTRDGISGVCVLRPSSKAEFSHFIGYRINGRGRCRVHATLSILDKYDKILRKIYKKGTAAAPLEIDCTKGYWGKEFTPTAEEKAQSVRADGSIRLRAEVRLFLD